MRFGVMLPHTNKIASPDAIIRTAETAEECGFYALTVHDHIVFNGHWIVSGARGIDTPGDKETTKLGKHRSNAGKEYDAVGVYGNRGRRTNEYIEACIEIWQNELATYQGKYTSFRDIEVFPKSVQKPHPPIFVGGRSEFAIQRAVKYGDGWNPSQPSAPQMRDGVVRLKKLCVGANRKPLGTFGINIPSVIASTDKEAEAIARPTVGPLFPGETEYQERTIIGSPDTFIRRVREFQDAGVNYVELKPLYPDMDHFMEQLRLIRDEVMPAV